MQVGVLVIPYPMSHTLILSTAPVMAHVWLSEGRDYGSVWGVAFDFSSLAVL